MDNLRQDIRVKTCIVPLDAVTINGKNINIKMMKLLITNISCGGCLFSSSLILQKGDCLVLILTFDNEPVLLNAQIVHKHIGDDCIYYGCKWMGLNNKEIQMIRKFVFKEQLNNRNKS